MRPAARRPLMSTAPQPTILLAEDHLAFRSLLAERLRSEGYVVIEVGDRDGFFSALARGERDEDDPRVPDLILADLRLPAEVGLEALTRLRKVDQRTPFVLLTSFGDAATHKLALELGADAVVDKPVSLLALIALVKRLVPLVVA